MKKNVICGVEIDCFSAAGKIDVNNKRTFFYVFSVSMGRKGPYCLFGMEVIFLKTVEKHILVAAM